MGELSVTLSKIRIFVTEPSGERYEITDLYWFEERGVHDFGGEGLYGEKYIFDFEFSVSGKDKAQ